MTGSANTGGNAACLQITLGSLVIVIVVMCLGLAACSMKAYGVCSKAFIKLESLDTLTLEERRQYEELSVDIFAKYASQLLLIVQD